MTGADHYRQAMQHLNWSVEPLLDDPDTERIERYHLACAQVHATLALAAAQLHAGAHAPEWQSELT